MIKKVLRGLLSMTSMGILVVILAVAMAVATFIESGSGTTTAKALIYNAHWFELVIMLTFSNILFNIFKYKLYVLSKLPVFLFHLSFLVIILGAGITRFIGSEGSMHIREGQTSNTMSSYNTYFFVEMENNGAVVTKKQAVLLSPKSAKQVNIKIKAFGNKIKLRSTDFSTGQALAQQTAGKNPNQPDAISLKVKINGANEEILLRGYLNRPLMSYDFDIRGVKFAVGFGTLESKLPFSLKLEDFQLERYPGTNSASSFASEVLLIDQENNIEEAHRISMNNILEYRGYRFYQSSYDVHDEKGTVLSVNHDKMGAGVTYIGYFLMILTIIAALFTRKSRFGTLIKATKKGVTILAALIFLSGLSSTFGQGQAGVQLDQNEVKEFGKLWVHSTEGRFMPVNTLAQDIVKKISGKNRFESMSPEEFWLRTLMNPEYWEQQQIFEIESADLAVMLGLNSTKVSFSAFFTEDGHYKLGRIASEAKAKKQSSRTGTDKAIIKLDDKLNAYYLAINGYLLSIFPHPTDPQAKWFDVSTKPQGIAEEDSILISNAFGLYLSALQIGDISEAKKWREAISTYQNKAGASVIPSEKKANLEVFYNKILIFERLAPFYATIGLILLVIQFMLMFRPKKWHSKVSWGFTGLLFIGFLFHTVGLGIRWYVSGHAPMSNGYESMIFVAWGTLLAGFFVVRRSHMAMALTGILAAVSLLVAHLSWMSPEITNLVPVLKSIWLTIHVAVVMTSYSFLGLGALIGIVVILLYIMKTRANNDIINKNILHLTRLNQIIIIIGLYLITIGCFLGAIWANEAWGRYWGWDPKETWCLIAILVYTFLGHMHNIKGLNSPFAFNVGSLLSFSSILMTYFGVNYFLGGMHSYAGGDSPAVPVGAYIAVIVIVVMIYLAYFNQQRIENKGKALK